MLRDLHSGVGPTRPPASADWSYALGWGAYSFFTFQNTIVGPFRMPVTFDRHAEDCT